MAIGVTFSPATDRRDANGNATEPVQAPQGSIQTLNYSLPKFSGNAPSPLITQSAVGSPFSSAVLASVFKTVLGADSGLSPAAPPSTSPIATPSRDTGIEDFTSLRTPSVPDVPRPSAPQAPQTRPTLPSAPAPATPQFDGISDPPPPPPPQQGAPLFDPPDTPQYASGYENPWAALGGDDTEQRRQYLDWASQMYAMLQAQQRGTPQGGAPARTIWTENAPTDGGATPV